MLTQRLKADPVANLRGGRLGSNLPPPAKLRTGHVPSGVLSASKLLRVSGNDSGSDMDITSDSEDEIYGGQYSLDSSPQDDKVPRYNPPMQGQVNFRNNGIHSGVSGSSRETVQQKQGIGVDRTGRGVGRNSVRQPGIAQDELLDSATSTEVSFKQQRNDGVVLNRGMYTLDSYSSTGTLQANFEMTAKQCLQDYYNKEMQNKKHLDNDKPSAPLFVGYVPEIELVGEQGLTFRSHGTPGPATANSFAPTSKPQASRSIHSGTNAAGHGIPDSCFRPSGTAAGVECNLFTISLYARLPIFHASEHGPWCVVISYDACVRLCLQSWVKCCNEEASYFLNNECGLLRNVFGLQKVLLQSEEELARQSSELVSEKAATKTKKTVGKIKVQVRRVKRGLDSPPGCSLSLLKPSMFKLESLRLHISKLNSTLGSGWKAVRKVRVSPNMPANGTFSQQSLAYVHASTLYIKEVSRLLKNGVTILHNNSSSYEVVQETYICLLRVKSSPEEDVVRMQPGSGESHVFFPDSLGDVLLVEVHDSKGQYFGHVQAQVAVIADSPGDKLRWWPIYHEPVHELVGRLQLYINYSTSQDENSHLKCGLVAETVAYDLVLEVAMRVLKFQQRNLLLNGPWKWLVTEFASYYGVSDAYTKLRYLSYVMDVATPTNDCLDLVHDLLLPVLMKGNRKNVLSHQENRLLGEVEDQVQQILAMTFENYKSLDEHSPTGLVDVFGPATGVAAPALAPAVKLYCLLHDILSPEAQFKLYRLFQAAAKKSSQWHLTESDKFFFSSNEVTLMDPVALNTAYQKMKSLILSIRNEIITDIEIHNQHLLPSFVDLPNLSASIYSVELSGRLRSFLISCPPSAPSPPVAELVMATADFQRDLSCWNINHVKGGVDAKELFHSYITLWIEDKRLALLELCKLDKARSGVRTEHSTTPFVDYMYDQLNETLNEYEVIIARWPEYTIALENAIADIERAVIVALDKQYVDVLYPLKDNLTAKIFSLKHVQKFAKGTVNTYIVPDELGILLNSMKRMLDELRPKIETKIKSWCSCIPDSENAAPGECFGEITVLLKAKFRNILQAVVEKLAENTSVQSATKLKKIIEQSKETVVESDVRSRMQLLKDLLIKTIDHLHTVFEPSVFIAFCRGFWDRMGQDILRFLENRRDNRSWYKSARIAVHILDDIFASQMQQLLGNALQDRDMEPPRSVMEVRSILFKDSVNYTENNYFY
ncbi:hypothetical protein CFOL_v3_02775 [Cephalotus follicularis]|uniref:Uncharacterized protein n=1 Tax=Cephalotus follicularis TaxID=3775 RepID=A0A1Q3AUB9_CEPFO|nr:hypothetical protein CFOL_v3_02775 [Cephalotus follicularis]